MLASLGSGALLYLIFFAFSTLIFDRRRFVVPAEIVAYLIIINVGSIMLFFGFLSVYRWIIQGLKLSRNQDQD